MPTSKKRTNICLDNELNQMLEEIAKRDKMPKASKAVELLKIGLMLEEDILWDKWAEERIKRTKSFVSHEDAWS